MAKLIYTAITSLDWYVADREGNFDWSAPDSEVHAVVNDISRGVGTLLLGRRMYEVLVAWETMEVEGEPPEIADFAAIWHASDKVVYSRTLDAPSSARTRIERTFDPDAVRQLKSASGADLGIGGPELAAQAIGPASWTSTTSSSTRSSLVAERLRCRTTSGGSWSSWASTRSRTASSTCTTGLRSSRCARRRC